MFQIVDGAIPQSYYELETYVPAADIAVHILNFLYVKLNEVCLVQGGEVVKYLSYEFLYPLSTCHKFRDIIRTYVGFRMMHTGCYFICSWEVFCHMLRSLILGFSKEHLMIHLVRYFFSIPHCCLFASSCTEHLLSIILLAMQYLLF